MVCFVMLLLVWFRVGLMCGRLIESDDTWMTCDDLYDTLRLITFI